MSCSSGWRLVRYVVDDCRIINEAWQVVSDETGVVLILVEDRVKPSLRLGHGCIVAFAGLCENVVLRVYEAGRLVDLENARGSATWRAPSSPEHAPW